MPNKIQIKQLGCGLYTFEVDDFSSYNHHILCSGIKSVYKYAHDAYKDAHKVAKKYSICVKSLSKSARDEYNDVMVSDASADDMIYNQYDRMLRAYRLKAKGVNGYEKKSEEEKEKAKLIYEEIKAIVGEILRVSDKLEDKKQKSELKSLIKDYGSVVKKYLNSFLLEDIKKMEKEKMSGGDISNDAMPEMPVSTPGIESMPQTPQAPPNPLAKTMDQFIRLANDNPKFSPEEINEMLNYYRDEICDKFKLTDSSVIGVTNVSTKEIVFKNKDGEFLIVSLGDNLLINNIVPTDKVAKIYPVSSSLFYQKYWKPVVEAVKHFFISHAGKEYIVMLHSGMPDIPNKLPSLKPIKVWDISNEKEIAVNIKFNDKNSLWTINLDSPVEKEEVEKKEKIYIENKYIKGGKGAVVVCIDENLDSIYKKTGVVTQIVPFENNLELDIDFGHHIVRLTESQIEVLDI